MKETGQKGAQFHPFSNYKTVSLGRIQAAIDAKKLDGKATVNAETLVAAGVLRRAGDGVRVLSDGELKTKLNFEVAGASKAAVEKIEKAGGKVSIVTTVDKAGEKTAEEGKQDA